MDFPPVAGIFISLFFSIFFSGMEVAFLSSDKLQIELMGKQGNFSGLILSFFTERPTWFIGTTLIGNIASLIFFGIFSTLALLPVTQNITTSPAGTVALAILIALVVTMAIL